ncbi:PPOX class probable F420-dependent enzyme [Nocardioides daedukensis]|uniref:PPOX class probable F420-dependent enzyme n=1 Tax=Nocardioides daedukensis TaxID=634462 RepID=A0A7Y9UTA5_9ACTN|nr:TIGR03618 family F420-dependent PPOX class oxidoreductase [Nocardioides daedukensis]NYG57689.1 PPOX class probable F420-dependent enzyme [Nocardioides daedukensis]
MSLHLLSDPDFLSFWAARHLCTVTTPRPDGSLHVTPMGIVLDAEARQAWGVTMDHSVKARNVRAGERVQVAVCQLDGPYWASLEGTAEILTDPVSVRRAEALYASRYRQPRENPTRVALRITLTRALGRVPERAEA